jgi:hypothetical protein
MGKLKNAHMAATMDDMGPIRIHIPIKYKTDSMRVYVRQESK